MLLRVAAATDIEIQTAGGRRIPRPARLRWTNRLPTQLPPLATANLSFTPA